MKNTILMNLILGVSLIFLGCSEDNLSVPEFNQNNQEKPSIKMEKVEFTGVSEPVTAPEFDKIMPLPNGNTLIKGMSVEWYDTATDSRVTGRTLWYAQQKEEPDGSFKYWGKAQLLVEGDGGKWEISWHGGSTPEGLIVAEAVGTGKEGDVKGLTAKWTYTLDFSAGFFYTTKGYIQSKQ